MSINLAGVGHADELGYLFNSNIVPSLSSSEDLKVSKILLDLWTSFAKNGYKDDTCSTSLHKFNHSPTAFSEYQRAF
jgi:hypothetical protein